MLKLRYFLFSFVVFITVKSFAQISEGGFPYSFKYPEKVKKSIIVKEVIPPDIARLLTEDETYNKNGTPLRMGVMIDTYISPATDGQWEIIPGEGRIWRLWIQAPAAKGIALYFDQFKLAVGATFFVYNPERDVKLGAFTHANNAAGGAFSHALLPGDELIIEYFEPQETNNVMLPFLISGIGYAYKESGIIKHEKGFDDSGSCNVNINCPEGNQWQNQKRGVVRILCRIDGNLYWCSGSLVNNTRQDCTPYILSADHCLTGATSLDLSQWVFYFQYEATGCSVPPTEPVYNTLIGASYVANGGDDGDTGSDFSLLLLNSQVPALYNPYYNGWDRRNITSSSGVAIHHPNGDIKKISTYTTTIAHAQWNNSGVFSHWEVKWASTQSGYGVTEGGSSGSPLFNFNGKIIGTLTGGSSTCDLPWGKDYFGKFYYHWELNGPLINKKLKPWLDPDNTGVETLDGTNACPVGIKDIAIDESQQLLISPIPSTGQFDIEYQAGVGKKSSIKIVSTKGNIVFSRSWERWSGSYSINLHHGHSEGIYYLIFQIENETITRKIVLIN